MFAITPLTPGDLPTGEKMPTPRIVSPVMGKSTHSGERTGLKCVESARTVVPLLTSDH